MNIAHIDADSFYASVEKRDNPDLIDKPVVVGSKSGRGVVTTACYVARKFGVRSAMPMYKVLKICPDAVVVPPNFEKYKEASRAIKEKMEALTPDIQTLSLDEAFLDLTSTRRLHQEPSSVVLARLVEDIRRDVGLTVSVGLSYCMFLAKIASDLEKPYGFSVVGEAEAVSFLKDKPVGIISGIGSQSQKALRDLGIETVGQLRTADLKVLSEALGNSAFRWVNFSNGTDTRKVTPNGAAKSISNERTFEKDVSNKKELLSAVWPLCEKVSMRAKSEKVEGNTITLKLKTSNHKSISRQVHIEETQLAEVLFEEVSNLLDKVSFKSSYRLVGVGLSGLREQGTGAQSLMFFEEDNKKEKIERTLDEIRNKWGNSSVFKGRSFK